MFLLEPLPYTCKQGLGKSGGEFKSTNLITFHECAAFCDANAADGCIAFDVKNEAASNACRLYNVDEPRAPTNDKWQYCNRDPDYSESKDFPRLTETQNTDQ